MLNGGVVHAMNVLLFTSAITLANLAAWPATPARDRTVGESILLALTHAASVVPQGADAKQSRSYDPAIDYTTEQFDLLFADGLHLEVVAGYEGPTPTSSPKN